MPEHNHVRPCGCILLVVLLGCAGGLQVEFSDDGYIEYQIPDPEEALNVILSSPHGGYLQPDTLPDRKGGCLQDGACVWRYDCGQPSRSCRVTTVLDTTSQEMTRGIANKLFKITGKRPYVVINRLSRRKVDMNREEDQATLDHPVAVQAYVTYHGNIARARDTITATPDQRAILFDVHSVGSHSEDWMELGYRITKTQLNDDDFTSADSSIANLAKQVCGYNNPDCFKQLLYGTDSFGGLLSKQGVKVIPGPEHTRPGTGGGYYRGGYTVLRHGALNQQDADAIQIEVPKPMRTQENYLETANKIALAIEEYIRVQYGFQTGV